MTMCAFVTAAPNQASSLRVEAKTDTKSSASAVGAAVKQEQPARSRLRQTALSKATGKGIKEEKDTKEINPQSEGAGVSVARVLAFVPAAIVAIIYALAVMSRGSSQRIPTL